ncbi:MAG: protein-L-isoaspartate(D-aspartate) O-methyltransferase [Alkalispirochaeta sp.]
MELNRCRTGECLVDGLHKKGIPRGVILDAFRYVPRDCFVPDEERPHAWEDRPLSIGDGQTISQPFTIAYMFHLAEVGPGDLVLDVGSGSGYSAALLAYIVGAAERVTTVEVRESLVTIARENLARVGMNELLVHHGDGKNGYPQRAPFDAIIVNAEASEVPPQLVDQLAVDGRLVMPVSEKGYSVMTCVHRTQTGIETTRHEAFQFVPLV